MIGIIASCRTEISHLTTLEERASAFGCIVMSQAAGFAVGPGNFNILLPFTSVHPIQLIMFAHYFDRIF